jgi:membrane fusion protein
MADEPLFRADAVAERRTQWLGPVLLAPRLSHRLCAVFGGVTAALVLAFLVFAGYTRKAHVNGWLVPREGLVQVFAPRAGVLTDLYVTEGTVVRRGTPLLALSAELQSATGGATQEQIVRRLTARRDSLRLESEQTARLGEQQARSLAERLEALGSEGDHLDHEIELQNARLALMRRAEGRERQLHHDGIVADRELQDTEQAGLEQEAKLRELARGRDGVRRDYLTLEGDLRDLPLKTQAALAAIDREIATVEQELAEAEAERALVVPAPEDGTVTAIEAERGGRAETNVPLLSIVPTGSPLEAHLYCASRAIGFVQAGQRVLLRYEAYPYQKFGHAEGTVSTISRSAINPTTLPPALAGMTSLFAGTEPVYRLTVLLERQTVTAYGRDIPLQPGMQLDADVLIERRPLIEWVLDPLFTLTGRWHA